MTTEAKIIGAKNMSVNQLIAWQPCIPEAQPRQLDLSVVVVIVVVFITICWHRDKLHRWLPK